MNCRIGCGACCIVPSISSPIPGMLEGKPAFVRCVQLTDDNRCRLFGQPERPAVCLGFKPDLAVCGETNEEALVRLEWLEGIEDEREKMVILSPPNSLRQLTSNDNSP